MSETQGREAQDPREVQQPAQEPTDTPDTAAPDQEEQDAEEGK